MASHYVYEDPDKKQLGQGDVLQRTPQLLELLKKYHPHYAEHPDYEFFAILTQSCDLVRRGGKDPNSTYVAICAARTLEETLTREAAKKQHDWQRDAKVIGSKEKNALLMFLQRLLDNNQSGYFYLHVDQELGIHRACCAVLALSVTLKAQHYDVLLDAKIAQLKDTFQAKLGWLIGNMYGRVGTTEWDTEYPDNPVKKEAKRVLENTLASVDDEQLKEGIAELKRSGQFDNKSPSEILAHIQQKNILPRRKKFEVRAVEVSRELRLVNKIGGRASTAIREGDTLKQAVTQILASANIDEESIDDLSEDLIAAFDDRLNNVLTDANLPGRNEIAMNFIRGILQDPKIAAILK